MTEAPQSGSARPRVDATRIGLLGRGIAATRTPRMHLAAAAALGLPYQYDLIDPSVLELPDSAEDILQGLQAQGYSGLNVTYPYKRDVLALMDVLSDAARNVGAVNTVVFRDGKRYGHNTDYWGFAESLRRGLPDAKRDRVLLLGAGGAGGAVSHALLDEGVGELLVRDVNPESAAALVATLRDHFGPGRATLCDDPASAAAEVDGLVNASPVGMEKLPGLPLPGTAITARHWVADVVYFPLETEFLATARRLGCAVLPGSGMALFQAVRAFELFTGCTPDLAEMKAAFDSFN